MVCNYSVSGRKRGVEFKKGSEDRGLTKMGCVWWCPNRYICCKSKPIKKPILGVFFLKGLSVYWHKDFLERWHDTFCIIESQYLTIFHLAINNLTQKFWVCVVEWMLESPSSNELRFQSEIRIRPFSRALENFWGSSSIINFRSC